MRHRFFRKASVLAGALVMLVGVSVLTTAGSAYAADGGGCNPSLQGWMGVCISEDGFHDIVADLYINGPISPCDQASIELIDNTTNTELQVANVPCDGLTGWAAEVSYPASPGHQYQASAIITYPYDQGISPVQVA
jgi:hypothetical protein